MMPRVEIYTTPLCPYCWRAKQLLDRKGVAYAEIDLWREPGRRAEMVERSGGRTTVPQVFVDGRPIGGSDDLHALEAAGELDALLAAAPGEPRAP
jgi:glutaredoxin 3